MTIPTPDASSSEGSTPTGGPTPGADPPAGGGPDPTGDGALLARLLAPLADAPLPIDFLEPGRPGRALPDALADLLDRADRRRAALERLERAGAVERVEEGLLRLFPARPLRDGEEDLDPTFVGAAAILLEKALPRDVGDPGVASRVDLLTPHAFAAADAVEASGARAGVDAILHVLSRLGASLSLRGRGEGALEALGRAERLAGSLEPEDPFLPVVLADQRASALQDAGRHEEGLAAARRAAELARSACSPADPRLAVLWNNVGGAHKRAGDFLTAEVYFRRVLDAADAGPDRDARSPGAPVAGRGGDSGGGETSAAGRLPPGLAATARLNLSDVLRARGRAAQARPFAERALEETEALRGPFAFETADAVSNLADLLEELGEVEEARRQARRALALYERRLGSAHPLVVEARARLTALERMP